MEKEVYIFGAGQKGKELLGIIKFWRNDIKVIAFIDNDEKKQGQILAGIKCIGIDEAIRRGAQNVMVLISVVESAEIEEQLEKYKFNYVLSTNGVLAYSRKRNYVPEVLEMTDFKEAVPFNAYDSPYPDIVKVHKKERELFDRSKECLDIDFNISRQLELLEKMKEIRLPKWHDAKEKAYRYFYSNSWFAKDSADALYYMLRILEPKKVIEVGSGYSTAVMLDTNEYYFNNKMEIFAIEPFADRLRDLLKPGDDIKLYEQELQDIPLSFFDTLGENDILFVDSSHVSKIGSDVNYLLFEIFPRLKKGVYIHIHDVYYPFTYLEQWVYEGKAWNEMYILRAFLMNNTKYSVQLFGSMLKETCENMVPKELYGCGVASLWIKKEA